MRKRDFLKKKVERTKDQSSWADFKTARDEVNNSIKYAKLVPTLAITSLLAEKIPVKRGS